MSSKDTRYSETCKRTLSALFSNPVNPAIGLGVFGVLLVIIGGLAVDSSELGMMAGALLSALLSLR